MRREVKVLGKNVRFDLASDADESVFEEVFVDRDYKVVDEFIKDGIVVDVGAHIGCFSVYCGILGAREVFAYEPASENFSALKSNLKLNGIKNVKCKNVAVGGESGVREFNLNEDNHNHSFFVEGEVVKVQCLSAKDLFNKFERIDLLKIDCEGAEFEIFDAMSSDDFLKCTAVYVEYHEFGEGMQSSKLADRLRKESFKVEVRKSHYDERMGFVLGTRNV